MRTAVGRLAIAGVAALAILTGSGTAYGQAVIDATTAEFAASPDHSRQSSDGTALLTRYVLDILRVGATTPSYSIDLGKPTPDTGGLVRVQFASLLPTPLVGGDTYQARVLAVGPGGSSASELSNPFASSAPCAPLLSTMAASLGSGAATGSVTVTAGTACQWTAVANASWLTITSTTPASGSGTVSFAATANTTTSGRSGTLTIAGQSMTITQAAAPPPGCTYAINPTARTIEAAGETSSVAVTAATGCTWTATSSASWITVTGGASGAGSGSVTVSVVANTATTQRTGTVAIAGRTYTVTQRGTCGFTVTPASVSASASGTTSSFSIATTSGCTWAASGVPTWISMATTTSTGSGTLSYTIAANNEAARSVTLTIAGRSIVINQSAAAMLPPSNLRIVKSSGGDKH